MPAKTVIFTELEKYSKVKNPQLETEQNQIEYKEENEDLDDDWEIPIISEQTLDKLTTMFTIYPE